MNDKKDINVIRGEQTENIAKDIKAWLSKQENPEIRMNLRQAEYMGINLKDISIVQLFREGIILDIIVRKAEEDDCLPKRLEEIIFNDRFLKVKITDKGNVLSPIEVVKLLMTHIDRDFRVVNRHDEFVKLRISNEDKSNYLDRKDVIDILRNIPDNFEILVDKE